MSQNFGFKLQDFWVHTALKCQEKSKVKVTLCQHAPRLPASFPALITFPFHPLVVSFS